MGDRGNVAVKTDPGKDPVVVYTHWQGSNLPMYVAAAVAVAEPRWDDPSYASRVIVHNLLNYVASPEEPAGSGINVGVITDNSHPIIVVDVPENRVFVISEARARAGDFALPQDHNVLEFGDATSTAIAKWFDGFCE